jgi:hypothetical protein
MNFLAALLKKLKGIGLHVDVSKLKALVNIEITTTVNVDRSTHRSIHIEGQTLVIDPSNLNGKQKRGLKRIIREDLLPEAGAIIDKSSKSTVSEVLKALPSKEEVAKKLVPIIPPSDKSLLYACLFLRREYQAGVNIDALKAQIFRLYGTRGGNFANLCSAGYLETWFVPLYDELLRANPGDPAAATAQFQIHYKSIVNDLPWTEFVSSRSSAAATTAHIVDKMGRNIKNGVRYLNIHGLGANNMRKIERILPDIIRETGAAVARTDRDPNRIFVRLEIPHGTSPA